MDTTAAASRADHRRGIEDDYLVRGAGRFVADGADPKQAYAAFARSPHACARIVSLNIEEAKRGRGVIAVLTGSDMEAAGGGNVGRHAPLAGRGGKKLGMPHRPAPRRRGVRACGEAGAGGGGRSAPRAEDGAERIAVEYEELKPVVDVRDAVKPDAPQLWPEAPGNIAVDWPGLASDPEANARKVDEIIRGAAHVARVAARNQRLMVASME